MRPPPAECCSEGGSWDSAVCNPLQDAVDAAESGVGTWIKVFPGTYCNKNFYKNVGKGPSDSGKSTKNSALVKIDGKSHIKIEGVDENGKTYSGDVLGKQVPTLQADGTPLCQDDKLEAR